jgi:hypothetical protein
VARLFRKSSLSPFFPPEYNPGIVAGPGKPVRLKVAYKTPSALLSELTRSVGRGGVAIESRRSLPVGTRFVFELIAQGLGESIEVYGEVLTVKPAPKNRFLLEIRYEAPTERKGIDALIQRIFDAQKNEKKRKHPRIPLHLNAKEEAPEGASFVLKDISRGGLCLEVEGAGLPRHVRVSVPFLLELTLSSGPLALYGETVWVFTPPKERQRWLNPSIGVKFGKLRPDTVERLERILSLRGLPPPPWKARVSFGLQAVERMP